jgi:hypothetical protein
MQNLVFAPITKVKENDDGTCEVYGTAAAEVVDKTREILDYALSKPQFEKWRDETRDRSQGKSLGNIRSMHGKIAAGKVTAMDFDDAGKTVNISTHIIDPVEAKKCALGVYTGFSVGGSYAKRWPDPTQKGVMRYSPELSEISIVDNPCIHSATFQHIKLDGATELCKFASVSTGFSRRKGRLEKPLTEKAEKVADQPRSAASRFAAGKTEDGSPHFGNILRGKAVKAKADGDVLGAATYSADAASHDAFAEGTPETHDKAAAAHTAAAQVHKDGNSPVSALLHTARAAHHKNEADSKRAVAAQKCTKCGGDMASGKCEKCEKAVGVGVPPQPAPFTQSFTNSDPTSVTTDFRGPADKVVKSVKYLVTEDDGTTHLPYTDDSGKPDHGHMGGAWAALHGGYRGNKYDGPNKAKAITQLKALYTSEGMDLPSEKWNGEGELVKALFKGVKCPNCGADIEDDYCDACDRKVAAEDDDDEELERMFLPRHEGFEKLFNDLAKGGPGSGRRPGGSTKSGDAKSGETFEGRPLSHSLKDYHPEAQRAFRSMKDLESKPWTPEAESKFQEHANTFRSHTAIDIHPGPDAPTGFIGTAVYPKGKEGKWKSASTTSLHKSPFYKVSSDE